MSAARPRCTAERGRPPTGSGGTYSSLQERTHFRISNKDRLRNIVCTICGLPAAIPIPRSAAVDDGGFTVCGPHSGSDKAQIVDRRRRDNNCQQAPHQGHPQPKYRPGNHAYQAGNEYKDMVEQVGNPTDLELTTNISLALHFPQLGKLLPDTCLPFGLDWRRTKLQQRLHRGEGCDDGKPQWDELVGKMPCIGSPDIP